MADVEGPRPPPNIQLEPGQQPTEEQLLAIQQHMHADAARMGISFEEYVHLLRRQMAAQGLVPQEEVDAEAEQIRQFKEQQAAQQAQGGDPEAQAQAAQQAQQAQQAQGQQQAVQPGPPKPEAVALANFLKNQDLKLRTCIFQGQRKEIFRVKRALRVIQSPAYEKARKKNPVLPEVTDRQTAEAVFKLLPMSLLALRIQKVDPNAGHEGHDHGPEKKKKRVKGQWDIEIVQHQEAEDDMYYMWLFEGPQWKQRAYSIGALILVMIFVMFPLWPLKLRQGAWYLSMAFFGLIVLFFAMAIVRLILFCITMFTHAPGLWLFPNLFEDVGFVDSFIPLWAWQEDKKSARKAKRLEREQKSAAKAAKANGSTSVPDGDSAPSTTAQTSGSDAQPAGAQRRLHASVEEEEE